MATVTFNVTATTITISPSKAVPTTPGEEVNFETNETVTVTFGTGKWPFTQTEGVITVEATTGAGPYTVHNKVNTIDHDSYTVTRTESGKQPIEVSGEIEID